MVNHRKVWNGGEDSGVLVVDHTRDAEDRVEGKVRTFLVVLVEVQVLVDRRHLCPELLMEL